MVKKSGIATEVDIQSLPENFPTHRHDAIIWECLGRTVATYGFLEEILARAIFALSGQHEVNESEIQNQFKEWIDFLKETISSTLHTLIKKYEIELAKLKLDKDYANLLSDLKETATIRNALCHGSWQSPDEFGRSKLFYVDKHRGEITEKIGIEFLKQTQKAVAQMACEVITSVTRLGISFPGRNAESKWQ